MIQGREPSPGRSIYERLGLSPTLDTPPRRKAPVMRPARGAGRTGAVLVGFLLVAGLSWYAATGGSNIGRAPIVASDEDERRMDAQSAQIQMLNQRIEMLEIKVTALQKLAGYETLGGERLPAAGEKRGAAKP